MNLISVHLPIETSVTRYKLKLLTEQRASKDELATALGVSPGTCLSYAA